MQRKQIESLEKWIILKEALMSQGYKLWQFQYDWDHPEGFIAGFISGSKRVEIVTHSKAIEDDIITSRW